MTLAEYTRCAMSKRAYAKACGWNLDKWQGDFVDSTVKQRIVNASRQAGKSRIISIDAAHDLQFQERPLVLVTARTLRQSTLLFWKIKETFMRFKSHRKLVKSNANTLETDDGGLCICLPGTAENIAGFSATHLIIDESAYADDKLFRVAAPMLAVSQGRLTLISTPFTLSGFFYEQWISEEEGWEKYEIPWHMCPRIPPAFIEKEKKKLGPWWFASQYECKFQDAADNVFRTEWLMRAIEPDMAPMFGAHAVEERRVDAAPLFSTEQLKAIIGQGVKR